MLAELALALVLAQAQVRGAPPERARALEARLERAARVVDGRLGASGPVQAEVAPDLETFERAGGRGRRAGAVALDGRILLPPLSVLDRLEDLDATLRHEVVHLRLADRGGRAAPPWLQEGLACELSGEALPEPGPLPEDARALAALDRRLSRPADPEAQARDYALARALVRQAGAQALLEAWPRLRGARRLLEVEVAGRPLGERLFGSHLDGGVKMPPP